MSKHRNKHHRPYTGSPSRQQIQARQRMKEMMDAQQGYIEESNEEIAESLDIDYAELEEQIAKSRKQNQLNGMCSTQI